MKNKLEIIDIDKYIPPRKIKQVETYQIFAGGGKRKLHSRGIFSEEIFGRSGSNQRMRNFGYIDLKTKIIHPEVYREILTSIDTDLTKLLTTKDKETVKEKKYIITEDGELQQDDNGRSGVLFFVENFDKINFKEICKKNKKDDIWSFIKKYKNRILIDKILISPAGIRDIDTSKKGSSTVIQYSEVNNLYTKLLRQTSNVIEDLPSEFMAPIVDEIQKTVLEINSWYQSMLKGKRGLIRGGVLKKIVDYSARLIITPDHSIKLGEIGIPWHVVLKLFEPFVLHHILKDDNLQNSIKEFTSTPQEKTLDIKELKRFLSAINSEPESLLRFPILEDDLFKLSEKISKDKVVIYKRDPVK